MAGLCVRDAERGVSGGGRRKFEPHRHPAHGASQLLQALATFLRPISSLHRVRLSQLRLPCGIRRNRCDLAVKSVRI